MYIGLIPYALNIQSFKFRPIVDRAKLHSEKNCVINTHPDTQE